MRDFKYCPMCREPLIERFVEGRDRDVCTSCGWIYFRNPLPAVTALVRNDRDEILLVKRAIDPQKGSWALPGGFIEVGETLREAAERELFEETGLKGKALRLIDASVRQSDMYGAIMVVGFEVEVVSCDDLSAGDDAEDASFFHFDDTADIPFISHIKMISSYRAMLSV